MAGFCTNCAAALESDALFCPACGASTRPTKTSASAPVTAQASAPTVRAASFSTPQGKRYPVLRLISILLKVSAVLWLIGSLGIGAAANEARGGLFIVGLIGGLYGGLMLWASAEMIHVLIDIEENTRHRAGPGQ